MKFLRWTLGLGVITSSLAFSQSRPPTATVTFAVPRAKFGQTVKGKVNVTFASGLHAYQNPPSDASQIPLSIRIVEKGFKTLKVSYPKGVDRVVGGETKPSRVYEGTISIPFSVRTPNKAGIYRVNVIVDYQQCSDVACFPPNKATAKGILTVVSK